MDDAMHGAQGVYISTMGEAGKEDGFGADKFCCFGLNTVEESNGGV